MNKEYYTYLGCSCAVEHLIANIEDGATPEVALVASDLAQVRIDLLNGSTNDPSMAAFEELFKNQVVIIMESIEVLRSSDCFANVDGVLNELLEHYYQIGDSLMGGGGSCSWGTSPVTSYYTP